MLDSRVHGLASDFTRGSDAAKDNPMETPRAIRLRGWLLTLAFLIFSADTCAQEVFGGRLVINDGLPALEVDGGSPDSCIPEGMRITRIGAVLTAELYQRPVFFCFSAGRTWTLRGALPALPAGTYRVNVVAKSSGPPRLFGTFSITLPTILGQPGGVVPTVTFGGLLLLVFGVLIVAVTARRGFAPK